MKVDTITEFIRYMETIKPISLKLRFFKSFFPKINIQDIDDYIVIFPISYYKYFTYIERWMHFSEFTDTVVSYKLMPFDLFDLCIDKPIRYVIPKIRDV